MPEDLNRLQADGRSPPGRRSGWLDWAFPVGICLAIISYQGSGDVDIPTPDMNHLDKVIHFFVFGLVATAWLRAFDLRMSRLKAAFCAIALTSLFGALDEFRQSFNPHRFAEVLDWVADTSGALVAVAAYRYWGLYRQILEWRPGRWRR